MVCEKNRGVSHNFTQDPIKLKLEGEWLKAQETTLGADNGIGVAAMLALLEDNSFETGMIECIFTVDEETGMYGAVALEPGMIQGKCLINLDSEEIGTLYIGCAGGRDSQISVPITYSVPGSEMIALELTVGGLSGGHSGTEIHMGKANAIKLLARILFQLGSGTFLLSSLYGGDKNNAIPREAYAKIVAHQDQYQWLKTQFKNFSTLIIDEFRITDPHCSFELTKTRLPEQLWDRETTKKVIDLLLAIPHGVLTMSPEIQGLVQASTNLASVKTGEDEVQINMSHRSSREGELESISNIHRTLADLSNVSIEQDAGYPGWTPDPESVIIKYAATAVRKVMKRAPLITGVHAGLECGIIKKKLKNIDAVSMGPTIKGAHSPDEKVNVRSVETFWEILLQMLKNIYSD
jgi:dipeptidase D